VSKFVPFDGLAALSDVKAVYVIFTALLARATARR